MSPAFRAFGEYLQGGDPPLEWQRRFTVAWLQRRYAGEDLLRSFLDQGVRYGS